MHFINVDQSHFMSIRSQWARMSAESKMMKHRIRRRMNLQINIAFLREHMALVSQFLLGTGPK